MCLLILFFWNYRILFPRVGGFVFLVEISEVVFVKFLYFILTKAALVYRGHLGRFVRIKLYCVYLRIVLHCFKGLLHSFIVVFFPLSDGT